MAFAAAAAMLSIFLLLLMVEAVFRAFNMFPRTIYVKSKVPGLNFEYRPNARIKAGNHIVRTNGHGFRGPDFMVKKPPGVKRIVVLGDSMTAAMSLPEESVYTSILQTRFARKKGAPRVEVLNMSVGGYNTMQEWLVLDRKAAGFSPDLVIVQFLLNDLTYSYPLNESGGFGSKMKNLLSENFSTYRFLKYVKMKARSDMSVSLRNYEELDPRTAPTGPEFMAPIYDTEGVHFREWQKAVRKFSARRGSCVNTLFVIFPWPVYQGMSRGKPYPYQEFHDTVTQTLDEEHIPWLDVTGALIRKQPLGEFWVTPDDFHLNAQAHEIIADTLMPEIEKQLTMIDNGQKRAGLCKP